MKRALLAIVLLFSGASARAACHVVTVAGSGAHTGADWNNAYIKLPATLTDGDTYYLADGSYGSYSIAVSSGSLRTIIRKAQTYDNCTSTGWNAGTMGSSQAIFTGFTFSQSGASNNVTIDGNGQATQPGCGNSPATTASFAAKDCGIEVDNSACTGGADACDGPISMSAFGQTPVTGAILQYMEWNGNGSNNTGNNREQNFVNIPQTSSPASFTFQHIYGHDTGCVYWQDYESPTYLIQYSYFFKNWSNPSQCHGQLTYDYGSQNSIFRFNVVRDIEGTAVFTFDDGATPDHWYAYGNIFYYSSPSAPGGQTGNGDAIIACQNPGSKCTNMFFYNNTIINWNYTTGIMADNSGGSYIWENNLMYQLTTNPGGGAGAPGGLTFTLNGSTLTEDYNSMIYSGSGLSGGHDVTVAGTTPLPFVSWTSNTNETVNVALASQNSDWNAGLNLGTGVPSVGYGCSGTTCVNYDMNGHVRTTWDRGAFEYQSSGGSSAPTQIGGFLVGP